MKNKKLKWHWNDFDQLLCKTEIKEKTMVAYHEKWVTCKRCKKILKREIYKKELK